MEMDARSGTRFRCEAKDPLQALRLQYELVVALIGNHRLVPQLQHKRNSPCATLQAHAGDGTDIHLPTLFALTEMALC